MVGCSCWFCQNGTFNDPHYIADRGYSPKFRVRSAAASFYNLLLKQRSGNNFSVQFGPERWHWVRQIANVVVHLGTTCLEDTVHRSVRYDSNSYQTFHPFKNSNTNYNKRYYKHLFVIPFTTKCVHDNRLLTLQLSLFSYSNWPVVVFIYIGISDASPVK